MPKLQLYHLGRDVTEWTNRLADEPKVVRAMTRQMHRIWVNGRSASGPVQPYVNPGDWPQADPFRTE